MRRLVMVLGLAGLAACEPLKEAFTARPDVVARAQGEALTVERLSQLAGLSKQVPLQPEAMRRLAGVWVDYTLFGAAIAEGRALDDSATLAAAMWPAIAQLRWERFHDSLVNRRATVSDAQVDSAFAAGEYRLFQHILLRATQASAPTEVEQKQRRMEDMLRQVQRDGSRFGRLASQHSEDPSSRERGGLLGVARRGQYVPPFEETAWALEPGAVSDVIRSPYGLHIIRRPPLAEVRDTFRLGLEDRIAFQLDSALVDSIGRARRLRVNKNAPVLTRRLVENFEDLRGDGSTLASYTGARFRVRDLARWLMAMEPAVQQSIQNAPDSQLTHFVRVVAERSLLVQAAEDAGVALTAEDWDYLRAVHDSALRTLYAVTGLGPDALRDSAVAPDARRRLAAAGANDYLDRVLQGQTSFVPVPPFLADALRQSGEWSISAAGIKRALERAQALRLQEDSATRPITPAPGPAPVPGADSVPPGGS